MKIEERPADSAFSAELYELLNQHSAQQGYNTRKRETQPYMFVLNNDDGKILGAIQGGIYGNWLDVYSLYSTREVKGVGKKLMAHIEDYARSHKCTGVKLTTNDFFAPEFYKKCGYEVYAEIDDLVEGYKNIWCWPR